MRPILILAAAAVLSACAPAATAGPAPAAGAGATIAFERKSWGKPRASWQVSPDGEGRYTVSRDAPSGNFREYDLVTKRFSAGAEGYARLAALLAPVEAHAGAGFECEITVTDMPYGTIRWARAAGEAELRYNLGCQSDAAQRVHGALYEADKLVAGWAADAPVSEVEEVREPAA